MRKRNTLYTVNKHNMPLFMPEENLFLAGGWSELAGADKKANPWNYADDMDTTQQYMNSKNAFGITKADNPFSKGNLAGGLKAGLGGVASSIGGMVGDGIGGLIGGGLQSGAGSAISSLGKGIGGAVGSVNPIAGAAISAASGIVAGGVNALFGSSVDEAKLQAAKQGTAELNNFKSNAGSFDAISGPQAVANVQDAHKGGVFTSGAAERKNAEIRRQRAEAQAFAQNSVLNNVNNLSEDQLNNALSNYAAFGGPLETIGSDMGAIGYGFMSDYLDNKRKQTEQKEKLTNMFMGTPSGLFADGGGIHIKPSHRGRLTELKERTGKTEAELYNDGNPAHKKMVVFARNARKWHADGGPLNLFYQQDAPLFAFGGDMQTNGADFGTGLTHIDAGGSHEMNPNDGVQMGVDPEGTPNLVEEGEVVFNDYVYSQRINMSPEAKAKFRLPKKKDITYADAAKKLEKEIAERVNDPISQAGFKAQMEALAEEQERQKAEMEAERAKAAFEALSPEEQTAIMQRAAQEEAMAQQASQQEALAAQQQALNEEQVALNQQQEAAISQPGVVGQEPAMMAEGGNLFSGEQKGSSKMKKNVGTWKNDKENHWDVFTKPGLRRYIENLRARLEMAPDDKTKAAIRKEAMNELNSLQQSYFSHVLPGAGSDKYEYSDDIKNHQLLFDRLHGNTGFYTTDENGNVKNLIAEAINLPKGAATDDKPENWADGYNGRRTSIRNFGSTEYGDDKYYKDLVDEFANLGLTYAPNENWKYGDNQLYGLSIPEEEAAKAAVENAPKVWDWQTGSWTDNTPEQPVVTISASPTPATSTEEKGVAPTHKAEWLRYAGLFGPAAGLGLQLAGVGKPDYSELNAALESSGDVALADFKPLGNYLTYRPMDIWFEQAKMDANARATDRAIMNNASPIGTKMAGLLANSYNSQLADGELYKKALEYNDAKRAQVAEFNRGTDQFNADAYNRLSQFNASALNQGRNARASLALQAAREKLDADAGWYNSLYGNLSGLFKGISDVGKENAQHNMIAKMAANGLFGTATPETEIFQGYLEPKKQNKKACGGKMKGRKGKRGLTF